MINSLVESKVLLSNNVGNTPLIQISDKIWAKAELLNPSGSLKDRMATFIINNAEEKRILRKGDTIVKLLLAMLEYH